MNITLTHDTSWQLVHARHAPPSVGLPDHRELPGVDELRSTLMGFDAAWARTDESAGLIGWAALIIVSGGDDLICPRLDSRDRDDKTDRPDHHHPSTAMGLACRTKHVRILGPGLEPTPCAAVARVAWSWLLPAADGNRQVALLLTECPIPRPAELVVPEFDDMARHLHISRSA